MSQFTVITQDDGKDVNIGNELQKTLANIDLSGYVLLLRSNVSEQQTETLHLFNVGNNADELTDMLMAASQYLPSNAMEG